MAGTTKHASQPRLTDPDAAWVLFERIADGTSITGRASLNDLRGILFALLGIMVETAAENIGGDRDKALHIIAADCAWALIGLARLPVPPPPVPPDRRN